VSDYFQYWRLGSYLRRYTDKPIGVTMGAASVRELFNEAHYDELDGGILESFGRLFQNQLRLYVYPFLDPDSGEMLKVDNLRVPDHLRNLYAHLVERGMVRQLESYNEECLHIFSRELLKQISSGPGEWEEGVPEEVAELIKKRGYFNFPKKRKQN
ncbi:MAG: TonB-dependent receptor, partial [bacterium]|nr:TonB-dependent receptor [bacterium]